MGFALPMSPSPIEFPIVNDPAGMSAMPEGMTVVLVLYKRKNLAGEVLVTVTAVNGTALLTVTQFGKARLVVLCRTEFETVVGQKRTV